MRLGWVLLLLASSCGASWSWSWSWDWSWREAKSTKPEQVHIALGENAFERVITWNTLSPVSTPMVEYGIKATGETTLRLNGTTRTFVDKGWKRRKIHVHRVTLKDLRPNTRYVYKVGGAEGWSKPFWFKTWPSGTDWSPRLNIYGDMGYKNAVSVGRIKDDVHNDRIDAVIHVGDFAYDLKDKNGKVGDKFMRMIEPIAAHVPYMVCPGNHEKHHNFTHYRERFSMPGGTENLYYSFNVGPVHFVSVNTEAYWYLEYGKHLVVDQYYWLERDLEEANKNREQRPWIVLYGHRPMYCSAESSECVSDAPTRSGLNKNEYGLEPLLQKYGVDIVFWGHQHNYERLFPVYDYRVKNGTHSPYVDPKAPVHIITGSAGCDELIEPFRKRKGFATAFRNSNYGVTEVQFLNATHMTLKQIATDDHDKVVDEMTLIKTHHGTYF